MKQPYQLSVQECIIKQKTNPETGLTSKQVLSRQKKYGLNLLPPSPKPSMLLLFLSQFKSPLIYVLLLAALIIFFVGQEQFDAFIIFGILFFNAVIGSIQEWRTQRIIESLIQLIKTNSIVLRDGKEQIIDDTQLVPGDYIVLQAGERVPADARIIQANNLHVDEAVLTGESAVVQKTTDQQLGDLTVGDRINMVFKGTFIRSGSGKAIVVATGRNTEIGKIQRSVEEITTEIPLQKQMRLLSYGILVFVIISCFFLFVIGLFFGRGFSELLVMLAALFICVIPEGLPVVLTITLVRGAYLMAQKKVLARNLQGVEGLGRTDVIVTDKTGTLTRNELVVTRVWDGAHFFTITGQGYFVEGAIMMDGASVEPSAGDRLYEIGTAMALLNTSECSYDKKLKIFEIKGDPTEAALYVLAQKMGLTNRELKQQYHPVFEIPFDARLKLHAGFYEHANKLVAYLVGAPEVIMAYTGQPIVGVEPVLNDLLLQGLRVVAVATKSVPQGTISFNSPEDYLSWIQKDVSLLGLCGIEDAIRPEVRTVVEQARAAGLRVVMATGDHKKTAQSVAEKVGIYKKGDRIVDGAEMPKMSDEQLLNIVDTITVFSRVSPDDKMRIIQLFHQKGKMVAMTGDGINDVPSLVGADVGIAMGGIGTEVAKNAADLVLLDDSFVNIINAIQLGRHVFYTLRRVILYFFSTNMAEILIVFFSLLTNLPLPLMAVQILWLNFVTDGFLDVGISMEPQEDWLLRADWLKRKPQLIDWKMGLKMMFLAVPMAIGSLVVYSWFVYQGYPLMYARTMGLMTLLMYQWFNAWNCRSEGESILDIGFFTNKWFLLAAGFVLSLQGLFLYTPLMQSIFKVVPLSFYDWLLILAVSSPIIIIEELRKWLLKLFRQAGY